MLRGDLPSADRLESRPVTARRRFSSDHLARNLRDVPRGLRSRRLLVDEPSERQRVAYGAVFLDRRVEQASPEQLA
jgi:hypothetical protein